jgi:hypothetical protein
VAEAYVQRLLLKKNSDEAIKSYKQALSRKDKPEVLKIKNEIANVYASNNEFVLIQYSTQTA